MKTLLISMFTALFMLTAFSFQGDSVVFDVPAAFAGDRDSSSSDPDSSSSDPDSSSSDPDVTATDPDDDEHKVTVCHSEGNSGKQTKMVNESSITAHIGHGDALGECEDDDIVAASSGGCLCPPGIMDCTCADGAIGTPSSDMPTAAGPIQHRSY